MTIRPNLTTSPCPKPISEARADQPDILLVRPAPKQQDTAGMYLRRHALPIRYRALIAGVAGTFLLAACGQLQSSASADPSDEASWDSPGAGATSTAGVPCDAEEVSLAFILSLEPTERLACFGTDEVRFEGYYPQSFGAGGCAGDEVAGDGWLRPCVLEGIVVYPQPGDANGLLVHLHPDMGVQIGTVPVENWLTIQGHFDDPAAKTCRKITGGAAVADPAFIEACRQEFVATDVEPSD